MNKNFRFAIALAAIALAAQASAQSVASTNGQTQSSTSNALIAPGAIAINTAAPGLQTINTTGTSRYETNQAWGAATPIATPAVVGTCATAGAAVTAQGVGAGFGVSVPGGKDIGCGTAQALSLIASVEAQPDARIKTIMKAAACQYPAVADTYETIGEPCLVRKVAAMRTEGKDYAGNTVAMNPDPYIANSSRVQYGGTPK